MDSTTYQTLSEQLAGLDAAQQLLQDLSQMDEADMPQVPIYTVLIQLGLLPVPEPSVTSMHILNYLETAASRLAGYNPVQRAAFEATCRGLRRRLQAEAAQKMTRH